MAPQRANVFRKSSWSNNGIEAVHAFVRDATAIEPQSSRLEAGAQFWRKPMDVQKPFWMRSKMTLVKADIWLPMNGPVSATTSMMATIFGTKVKVISWTCVSAWMRAMPMPTTMATSTTGADAVSTVHTAYWTMSRASASFMGLARRERQLAALT